MSEALLAPSATLAGAAAGGATRRAPSEAVAAPASVPPPAPANLPATSAVPEPWTLQSSALRVLHWAPVWAPLLFLLQILLFGLFPAVFESHRLAQEEARMDTRASALEHEHAELLRLEQAQNDPIYLERERRVLAIPPQERAANLEQAEQARAAARSSSAR